MLRSDGAGALVLADDRGASLTSKRVQRGPNTNARERQDLSVRPRG